MTTTLIFGSNDPVVRPITVIDVVDSLGEGLRDFQARPIGCEG